MAPSSAPSIFAIRMALERIEGGIRHEPLPGDAAGADPGTPIFRFDPDELEAPSALDPRYLGDEEVAVSEQPAVIFEVPPKLTDADVVSALGEGSGELARLAPIKGTDALGWYVTFHQRAVQHGVFLPIEGVIALALGALKDLALPLGRRLEIAFHAILRHELFHFEADCMAANWELATGRAVYWWADAAYREISGHKELEDGCRILSANFEQAPPKEIDDWEIPRNAFDTLTFYPNPIQIDWRRCPVLLYDRLGVLKTLGIGVDFFETIAGVVESASFSRALTRLGGSMVGLWERRQADLARSVSLNSLGFERWKPGGVDCYSIRLDGNYRVHLRLVRTDGSWIAESIGDHKSMGHG